MWNCRYCLYWVSKPYVLKVIITKGWILKELKTLKIPYEFAICKFQNYIQWNLADTIYFKDICPLRHNLKCMQLSEYYTDLKIFS